MTIVEHIEITSTLIGGLLIGSAVAALLLLNGQIAGVSGILGRSLQGDFGRKFWRAGFVAGLVLAGVSYLLVAGTPFPLELSAGHLGLIAAGLLVGIGTGVGSGCTSGHGVCGVANLSARGITATAVFMLIAALVVYLVRHVLAP